MNPHATAHAANRLARRSAALLALALLALPAWACNKLKARALLNKGVASFKGGQYDDAVEKLKQAKDLDPDLTTAGLYLATAYASQYIPGAPSEENVNRGKQAIQEYQEVLQKVPGNLTAIDGIGSILFQMAAQPYDPKKFEESKTYHQRHIGLKPDDPDPYYWVGVIDWTIAFRDNAESRADYNKNNLKKQVKDTDPLRPGVRQQSAEKYGAIVDEGINALQKAIQSEEHTSELQSRSDLVCRL